jgi:hypothetical protein
MKSLLPILLMCIAAGAQAQTSEPLIKLDGTPVASTRWDAAIAAGRIEPGMPAHIAVGLLGRTPDDTSKVGACGTMDVLTWQQDKSKVRLLTVDGVVTSVSTSDNAKQ